MNRSDTHETTGFLHAQIGGERWEASSVVLYLHTRNLTVGGPKGGAMEKGLYFDFPRGIRPGQYKITPTSSVEAWFNPGKNAPSWVAYEGVVTVASVSEDEPSITLSCDYIATNPLNPSEHKKITGTAQFKGASTETSKNHKIQS
ncbi:hypothetical protein JBE38_18480 [Pseudomonas sp. ICBG1301]|uniref:hypothetical protein n=1 Tax=Pseudomonas sp. ICBG1301 TaxID=2795987 RepID=UPI001963B065|nr:hypothetical protein [Pseudomonas sp. ICBG1301]MBM9487919.1 hypothetical protein [Pseudomonas sp. ICBG1301]